MCNRRHRSREHVESTQPATTSNDVIHGVVFGGLGAVGGLGATLCMRELFQPMRRITARWAYQTLRGDPDRDFLESREWDAFGHCWIACEGTRHCGLNAVTLLGTGRELWRELEDAVDWAEHDSLWQDIRNQRLGRALAYQAGTCCALCNSAYNDGRMDLTAPLTRRRFNLDEGRYEISQEELDRHAGNTD